MSLAEELLADLEDDEEEVPENGVTVDADDNDPAGHVEAMEVEANDIKGNYLSLTLKRT